MRRDYVGSVEQMNNKVSAFKEGKARDDNCTQPRQNNEEERTVRIPMSFGASKNAQGPECTRAARQLNRAVANKFLVSLICLLVGMQKDSM